MVVFKLNILFKYLDLLKNKLDAFIVILKISYYFISILITNNKHKILKIKLENLKFNHVIIFSCWNFNLLINSFDETIIYKLRKNLKASFLGLQAWFSGSKIWFCNYKILSILVLTFQLPNPSRKPSKCNFFL